MRSALADLELEHLFVVAPGRDEWALAERVSVVGLEALVAPRAAWRARLGRSPANRAP